MAQKESSVKKLEFEIEKQKISARYNLAVTFLGTFLVAVIGSYLTFAEKTEKNQQDFDGGHRDFVAKFVEIAIDDDIERRQRLARYFAFVTLDTTQKGRWEEYSKYLENLVEENPTQIANLREELESASKSERGLLEARIEFLERQLGSNRPGGVCPENPDGVKVDRDLTKLHPALREKVVDLLAKLEAEQLPFRIFEAYRSPHRQRLLYNKGRESSGPIVTNGRPWQSLHNFGLAVDLVRFEDGRWNWMDSSPGEREQWARLHELMRESGLEPVPYEKPHAQLPGVSLTNLMIGQYPEGGDVSWSENLAENIALWAECDGITSPALPPLSNLRGAEQ
ncbi:MULTISPECIES: M15 family metallopeptidase [unclassified Roseovarius]|uniref:M15 family metallopeptidase n=1 Tax=unclassified Roseovarius TaxID=2614913 RepID=UPI00273E3C16|nr:MULTISPECIES: M15 family metallopeptidase [unclassified Roseovarius]